MADTRQIRVLHIASGDIWAGAEVQMYTLATTLHTRPDVKVVVILFNHGKLEQKLRKAGIEVSVVDESELNGFQILSQLVRKFGDIKPDVIHTHRAKENILGSIAARLHGNIPSLRTAHGAAEHSPPWYHFPKRLVHFLDWFCGRFLQRKIIAVSEDLAGILQKDFRTERIEVIENGIDPASLSQSVRSSNTELKNPEAKFKVGIAGRLVPVKRVDIFIRSAAEFMQIHPDLNTSFHIYGDGPLRNDLEALTRELEVGSTIHFEGHCENMHQALSDLDALLVTSDHEGLPMILLEAMALRTPIIAHAVGGIPVVLDQGGCGVLVSDHRPSAYAEEIYQLIKNHKFRTKIIHNALSRVATFYSSEKNANVYHTIYRSLVAQ